MPAAAQAKKAVSKSQVSSVTMAARLIPREERKEASACTSRRRSESLFAPPLLKSLEITALPCSVPRRRASAELNMRDLLILPPRHDETQRYYTAPGKQA